MANNYTEILALANKNNMGLSNTIKRDYGIPLDYSSVQETYEAALNYAKTSTLAYIGQPISVGDTLYIVTDEANGYLKAVGTKPTGDNKSITVDENGVVSMFGFKAATDAMLPQKKVTVVDGATVESIEWITIADLAGSTDTNTKTVVTAADGSDITVTPSHDDKTDTYTYTLDVKFPAIPEYSVAKEVGENQVTYKVTKDGTQVGEAIIVPNAYDDTAVKERLEDLEAFDHSVYALATDLDTVEEDIATIKGEAEGSIKKALADAKAYADGLATNYDASGAAATAESNAKAYTDDQITGLDVTITEDNKIQITNKAGSVVAEVDASKFVIDGMLDDASYDTATNELVFTWNTAAGTKTDRVSVAGLVDTYTAGSGLKLTDHEFSVDTDVIATKASVETAQNAADNAQTTIDNYITAHTNDYTNAQVDTKVSDAIAALKIADYAKSADVVSNATFNNFKTENTNAIAKAVSDQATIDDGKYATKAALNDTNAKFGNYTTTETLNTLLGDKVSTEVLGNYYKKTETYSAEHIDELLEAVSGGSSETAASVKAQLDAYKKTNDEAVAAIQTKNTTQDTNITANTNAITAINAADTGILAQAKSYTDSTNANTKTAYEAADKALGGRIDNVIALISGEGGTQAQITALDGRVNTVETDIATLKTTTSGHTTTIGEHSTKIAALEEKDTELANLIQANTDKFDGYYTKTEVDNKVQAAIDAIPDVDFTPYLKSEDAEKTYAKIGDAYTKSEADSAFMTQDEVDARINTLIVAADPEGGKTIENIQNLVKYVDENAGEIATLVTATDKNTEKLVGIDTTVTAYVAAQIAAIPTTPIATTDVAGTVKASEEIAVATDGKMSISKVSTDVIAQGVNVLVLDGGNAGITTTA